MTEIENLEDKIVLVEDAVDNDNQETIESPTNNFIFYYSVFSNEALIPLNHPVESNKLLTFLSLLSRILTLTCLVYLSLWIFQPRILLAKIW